MIIIIYEECGWIWLSRHISFQNHNRWFALCTSLLSLDHFIYHLVFQFLVSQFAKSSRKIILRPGIWASFNSSHAYQIHRYIHGKVTMNSCLFVRCCDTYLNVIWWIEMDEMDRWIVLASQFNWYATMANLDALFLAIENQ